MRRSLALVSLAALSCTELPAIEPGLCGNAVVERSAGEDCDSFAAPGSVCLPPGDPRECRYDCTAAADGTRADCPAGMGCGVDGTCRWPSGSFDPPGSALAAKAATLLAGDLDGDRREELVIVESARARVLYFASGGALEAELPIPASAKNGATPEIADVSEDGRNDILLPHENGVVTALGSAERQLRPTGYPSVVLPPDIDQAVALELELLPELPGTELVLLASTTKYTLGSLVYVSPKLAITSIGVTLEPIRLAGPMRAGSLDEDPTASPCDEILLAFRDLESAFVVEPCRLDPSQGIVLNLNASPVALKLPNGDVVGGPTVIVDLDQDGHLDVGVVGKNGAEHFLEVAYGLGDGTFHSTSPVPATGDGLLARASAAGKAAPLAIMDLNDDGALDFVSADGIFVRRSVGFEQTGQSGGASLGEAVVADLNANGRLDVLATYTAAPGALFFNGAGDGQTSASEIASEAPLSRLAVGDFDGDLILDVAASEHAGPGADFASVLFGRLWGPPDAPVHMGLMDPLLQLARARSPQQAGLPVTSEDDLLTLSLAPDQGFVFGGFAGRSDRNLRAPFVTVRTLGSGELVTFDPFFPVALAVGRFDSDAHPDLAELGTSASGEQRLWLVPMTAEARIRPSDASASEPLSAEADFSKGMLASADLNGDGVDEVVVLAPAKGGSTSFALVAESAEVGAKRSWVPGSPKALPQRFERGDARRLMAVDLDADGAVDLLALDQDGSLWLARGNSTANLAGLERLLEASGPISAFVTLEADRDPTPELLVLSEGRAFVADLGPDGSYRLANAPAAELAGATLVSAGDYDGDGVTDIALGSNDAVVVARGAPGLR